MIKKIYGLFSVLLLLASCATEEIEQIEIQPTDGSMVSLSFSVDAPNALEITKATGDVEKGVESLYLYTFKENGEFISPVVFLAMDIRLLSQKKPVPSILSPMTER